MQIKNFPKRQTASKTAARKKVSQKFPTARNAIKKGVFSKVITSMLPQKKIRLVNYSNNFFAVSLLITIFFPFVFPHFPELIASK
jgi:hypothetical protein